MALKIPNKIKKFVTLQNVFMSGFLIMVLFTGFISFADRPTNTNYTYSSYSNTPTPTLNNQQVYFEQFYIIALQTAESIQIYNNIKNNPEQVFADPNLQDKVYTSKTTIEKAYNTAKTLSPPANFEQGHNSLLQALQNYEQALTLFDNGLQQSNGQLIVQSGEFVEKGNLAIEQVYNQLQLLSKPIPIN